MNHRALCALILIGAATAVRAAEPVPQLGRLFLTPDWRATLERQRQLNIQETRSLEGASVRLDGVVVRSSGKTTVWVNNQPQNENAGNTGVAAATSMRQPGQATLVTGTEAPADLKVGVTLNRSTRETADGLAGGEIRVTPARRK
ncbi:MAG: hypothetical protein AB1642_09730 [Pseudomonadota bacterium]